MLVVSDDAFNTNDKYPKVMVVHLTSAERPGRDFDWEVALPRGTAGLERASVIKCGEVYTLWKEQLEGPGSPVAGSRFLQKPFAAEALLVALRGILGAPPQGG